MKGFASVLKLAGGADDSWASLLSEQVRVHARLFYAEAYRILRDPIAAEEACQEAMRQACARPGRVRDPEHLRAWLCRIVRNESLLILRRRGTDRRTLDGLVAEASGGQPPVPSAERGVDVRESVKWALGRLSDEHRVVVTMRMIEGRSGNEVAELLDWSASDVSICLKEAMARLRQLLADWDQGGKA